MGGIGYHKGKGGGSYIEHPNISVEYIVSNGSFLYDFILCKPICVYMSVGRIKLI